ncbi:PepSY domain-containing protein [Parvularcula marina]|uniref:PepSY domain-containing protein n=1 Tax=Parvularcula marina TaxID=2292771 RepID=A0A371REW4_9PROT|nr:PepSY domain-containing protein [Parvularcula marina]RFB03992.1 PepSY domain-containing protein [Parvularcula marina]
MKRIITRIHLWAGLLLGLQVAIWMASGVIMSWFPIEEVRGETRAVPAIPDRISLADARIDLAPVLAEHQPEVIRLKMFRGSPVFHLEAGAATLLLDATSLEPVVIDERLALAIARDDYMGEAPDAAVRLIETDPPLDYAGSLPVWQVKLHDRHGTRIYISPEDGRITARRNNVWRLYDTFWMLHIMDYGERHDFNNPLVKTASLTGLIFALSGLFLVIFRLRSGRYEAEIKRMRSRIFKSEN